MFTDLNSQKNENISASLCEYYLITLSFPQKHLGNLVLISLSYLSSKYVVVFLIPSAVFDARSITPVTGLNTAPINPLPTPLKNPSTPIIKLIYKYINNFNYIYYFIPFFYAPSTGLVNIPVIPFPTPVAKETSPIPTPSTAWEAF